MKVTRISSGGIIFFEDTMEKTVYVLKKGKVELRKKEGFYLIGKTLKKTREIKEGDVFGFEELYSLDKRNERATALEDCELISFETEEFGEVIKKNIKIGEKVLNSLAARVRGLNNKIKKTVHSNIAEEEEGDISEIYLFFLKTGERKKAYQVLERMEKIDEWKNFVKIERKKEEIDFISGIDIDKVERLIEIGKESPNILYAELEGLERNISLRELKAKINYEKLKILRETMRIKEYKEKSEIFMEEFSDTPYLEKITVDLIQYYKENKNNIEMLNVVNNYADMEPSEKNTQRIKKLLESL